MIAVSVVITIYNEEKYIEECLKSVLQQTLTNIEIICVDDESQDNSMDIVENYAKNDTRIKIFHKKNGGTSSARNFGLKNAFGEYVYFLDGDDYIKPETLKILYNECKKNDLDTIFFDAESIFESKRLAWNHSVYFDYYHRKKTFDNVMTGQDLFLNMENNNEFRSSACLQMNKTDFLLRNAIKFNENIICEDNLFTMTVMLYAKKTKHISLCLYVRRVRENSKMTKNDNIEYIKGIYTTIHEIIILLADAVVELNAYEAYVNCLTDMWRDAKKMIKNRDDRKKKIRDQTENDVFLDIMFNVEKKNGMIDLNMIFASIKRKIKIGIYILKNVYSK